MISNRHCLSQVRVDILIRNVGAGGGMQGPDSRLGPGPSSKCLANDNNGYLHPYEGCWTLAITFCHGEIFTVISF